MNTEINNTDTDTDPFYERMQAAVGAAYDRLHTSVGVGENYDPLVVKSFAIALIEQDEPDLTVLRHVADFYQTACWAIAKNDERNGNHTSASVFAFRQAAAYAASACAKAGNLELARSNMALSLFGEQGRQ